MSNTAGRIRSLRQVNIRKELSTMCKHAGRVGVARHHVSEWHDITFFRLLLHTNELTTMGIDSKLEGKKFTIHNCMWNH